MSGSELGGQENHRRGSGYLEVASTDTKRWTPQRVWYDTLLRVALSSIPYAFWVIGAKRMQCGYLEVGPTDTKRWPPPRVWCGTLLRVALSPTPSLWVQVHEM